MTVLLFIYAIAMAVATFIENDFDTPTAKTLIYESRWFEILMLWLIILFIANIKRYQLYKKEKWPLLVFHLAFVFIFIGGAITRYISFEGTMPIKEGETTNEIISERTYFKLLINNGERALQYDNLPYMMSYFNAKDTKWPLRRTFHGQYAFEDKLVTLKTLDYVPMAKDSIRPSQSGKKTLEVVSMGQNGRQSNFIQEGEIKNVGGIMVTYNRELPGSIQLFDQDGQLKIKSPFQGQYMTMTGQEKGVVVDSTLLAQQSGTISVDSVQNINYRTLYTINNSSFIIPKPAFQGEIVYYSGSKFIPQEKELPGAITVEVSSGTEKDTLTIIGGKGITAYSKDTQLNGLNISVGFGSKIIKTPFSIMLNDFILDTYPGSTNPSSFESEITLIDEGKEMPHHIYMNNVLDYKGYRFFQSSYFPDETGTILSVNADWWGTNVTYLGYFLLFFGLFATLFWKGTRFWKINSQLKSLHSKKMVLLPFLLFMSLNGYAQHNDTVHKSNSVDPTAHFSTISTENAKMIDPQHAEKFGRILVQDFEGRIKPMNTHALEILRKIYKKDNYNGISAEQWFLSIQIDPTYWANEPMIKVSSKGGDKLLEESSANKDGYVSYLNLIDQNTGQYRFEKQYNEAFSKRPADRTKYEEELINLTERFNIFSNTAYGYFTKITPVKNDPGELWTSWLYNTEEGIEIDSVAFEQISKYFSGLKKGLRTNDWKDADTALNEIDAYQKEWGKNVLPPASKVNLEILYNKLNIFFWLMIAYSLIGFYLVIVSFFEVLSTQSKYEKYFHYLTLGGLGLLILFFLLHLIGLAIRWYLSGHAPWSNGYEAIIFISWVGVLAGLILYKNRNAFIPATGALVAMIMMGFAHGGSMLDPQITPLVPVLKSYWLMVHVGIITASYGFFGLSAVIAVISLILICFKPTKKISHSLKEITLVSEMSTTIGLFALTVGTFLGGMWANESWGRYWSWDPKETWAFISVIVYAIVLHLRLVPGLRGRWVFNVFSMWAIWTVIMTYFGVNYYLSGLHSYAAGDPIPIPNWIWFTLAGMLLLSIGSYIADKRYHSNK